PVSDPANPGSLAVAQSCSSTIHAYANRQSIGCPFGRSFVQAHSSLLARSPITHRPRQAPKYSTLASRTPLSIPSPRVGFLSVGAILPVPASPPSLSQNAASLHIGS